MKIDYKEKQILHLSISGYWMQLEVLVQNGKMPSALADCIKELVNSKVSHSTGPEAKPQLIKLMKKYLTEGIWLSDSCGGIGTWYDVAVYALERPNKDQLSFFEFVRRYHGRKLKRLEEL